MYACEARVKLCYRIMIHMWEMGEDGYRTMYMQKRKMRDLRRMRMGVR